jgi:hypothetical protein
MAPTTRRDVSVFRGVRMALGAIGFLLLPVPSLAGFVLLVIAVGAEKQVLLGVVGVYAERGVAMVQTVNARRDRPIDERPNKAMGFPQLPIVLNRTIAGGKLRSEPNPAARVNDFDLLPDDRRDFT